MIPHVVDLQTWPNSSLRLDVRAIAGVSVSSQYMSMSCNIIKLSHSTIKMLPLSLLHTGSFSFFVAQLMSCMSWRKCCWVSSQKRSILPLVLKYVVNVYTNHILFCFYFTCYILMLFAEHHYNDKLTLIRKLLYLINE